MIKLDKLFAEQVYLELDKLSYIDDYAQAEALHRWLTNLSYLDLGEAAKQIFVTLLELRHLDCDDGLRDRLFHRISAVACQLCQALEKQYQHQSILETRRDQQIAQLVLEIRALNALILSDIFQRCDQALKQYNICSLNVVRWKKLKNLQQRSALYALSGLTQFMHAMHSLYLEVPKNFWLLCYRIYAAAQNQKIHLSKVAAKHIHPQMNTIEQAFKELLLLQILNSHKLSQIESKNLKLCIPYWHSLIGLSSQAHRSSKYILTFTEDRPPQALLQAQAPSSDCLFIDLDGLKHTIAASIDNGQPFKSMTEQRYLSSVLKFHILSILNESNIRKNTRYKEDGELEILFGIAAAHYYLSQSQNFSDSLQLSSILHSTTAPEPTATTLSSDHNGYYLLDRAPASSLENPTIHRAGIVNRSAGGFCLQWSDAATSHLRTGCFVMTRSNIQEPWHGGLIRWIKSIDHKNVQLGIESFGDHMMSAVAVKMLSAAQQHSYQPAIILTGVDDDYSIILQSSQIYYEQQKLCLRLGNEDIPIILKTGRTLTSNCARFGFDVLESKKLNTLKHLIEYKAYNSDNHTLREIFQ